MAITTIQAHVSRALDFYKKENIFFCIAHPNKWKATEISDFNADIDYDLNPPVPKNTDVLIEPLGYKRVEFKSLVVPDNNGSLLYRNEHWSSVTEADAVTKGARWVYLEAELNYDELPTTEAYRQVGIYTGLTPISTISPNQYVLLPNQVKTLGMLEVLDDRKPVYRDNDVREILKIILEF